MFLQEKSFLSPTLHPKETLLPHMLAQLNRLNSTQPDQSSDNVDKWWHTGQSHSNGAQ